MILGNILEEGTRSAPGKDVVGNTVVSSFPERDSLDRRLLALAVGQCVRSFTYHTVCVLVSNFDWSGKEKRIVHGRLDNDIRISSCMPLDGFVTGLLCFNWSKPVEAALE